MRVVPDRRRTSQPPETITAEDLLHLEAFDTGVLGRSPLSDTEREGRKFLPPPRVGPRRRVTPPREPESRWSKVAKLAGLTTASCMLVGAVITSSVVTRARTEEIGRADPAPAPPPITGTAALGGFALQSNEKPDPAPRSQTSRTRISSVTVPQHGTDHSAVPSTSLSRSPASERRNSERLEVVDKFYQRIAEKPADALHMLAPGLAGDKPSDLIRAWSKMARVDVNDRQVQPDGSVRAVATVTRKDGSRVRVTQVFGLTTGNPNLISRVELLFAEQL